MLQVYGYTDNLNYGWIDIEFPQISKDNYKVGYEPVYRERTTIGGQIQRKLLGYRMNISWTYPYLLEEQRKKINNILRYANSPAKSTPTVQLKTDIQGNPTKNDPVSASSQIFEGNVYIDYNPSQTRFMYSETLGEYVWTNWTFTAKSESLIK